MNTNEMTANLVIKTLKKEIRLIITQAFPDHAQFTAREFIDKWAHDPCFALSEIDESDCMHYFGLDGDICWGHLKQIEDLYGAIRETRCVYKDAQITREFIKLLREV